MCDRQTLTKVGQNGNLFAKAEPGRAAEMARSKPTDVTSVYPASEKLKSGI